ncbi:ATP-grasp fold amidoligase family protein [Euzebyella saccharophila]|uniref:ATP-grasp fold amidoligase family protein n=1 Tax=Euzebyella saccharophila TaxID=679664 RepID=A0ABV8JU30_9FLAO|nr:ATP-grasp fold amidoligase family protein [Euzebyella saccharophila]
MKKILKKISKSGAVGKYIIQIGLSLYNYYWTHIVSDKKVINKMFLQAFGRKVNFQQPITLNEKINWLKINDRSPLHTRCVDKYAVREYISEKIGEEYLVPLYFRTSYSEEITNDNLPDKPCIIKTNHDSGGGYFVKNKKDVDLNIIRIKLRNRLRKNYYYKYSREWQYKNIKPCVIVESLLQTKDGKIPMDYKLHCFNGKVRMIQVDIDRGTEYHYRNWYDIHWKREPYRWSSKKGQNKFTDPANYDVAPPESLKQMIKLSELLAKPFVYVRVDWYDVDGKLYFGEITFHHDSGYAPIIPEKYDIQLGKELVLQN